MKSPVVDRVKGSAIVNMALLKERLSEDYTKRERDPEARKQALINLVKDLEGEPLNYDLMDELLGWTAQTTARIMRPLLRAGYITFTSVPPSYRGGPSARRYFYHDKRVAVADRTVVSLKKHKDVAVRQEPKIVQAKAEEQFEIKIQKARDEREAQTRAFVEQVEREVWEYLRDADSDEGSGSFVSLKLFVRHLREKRLTPQPGTSRTSDESPT